MSSQLEKLVLMMMDGARWCERYVVIVVYGEHDMVGRASWLCPGRYSSEFRLGFGIRCTLTALGLGLAVCHSLVITSLLSQAMAAAALIHCGKVGRTSSVTVQPYHDLLSYNLVLATDCT